MAFNIRKTSIIATAGPATSSPEMLEQLMDAGVNVFRLNFSHGSHDDHRQMVQRIRSLSKDRLLPIGILQDLQGPKIRIGTFAEKSVTLTQGQDFVLDHRRETLGDSNGVAVSYEYLHEDVAPGEYILLDDGRIVVRVTRVDGTAVHTQVIEGEKLSNNKGINIPNTQLQIPALTDKDADDLRLGAELGVDWVALSFVRTRDDIKLARHYLKRFKSGAKLMAKIEKPAEWEEYEAIIAASDGVMIARGDLGVELSPERVPMLQKRLIYAAREHGKPVVTATQMLDSMTQNRRPTRAEASDVANAIHDGTDAVMLSQETAVGEYPVEAVRMMHRIAEEVEADPAYRRAMQRESVQSAHTTSDSVAGSACHMADDLSAKVIVCFSHSGATAGRVSRHRLGTPILVITPNRWAFQQLSLVWGVHAVLSDDVRSTDEMVREANRWILKTGMADIGDRYVITAGVPFGVSGSTNLIRAERVQEVHAD